MARKAKRTYIENKEIESFERIMQNGSGQDKQRGNTPSGREESTPLSHLFGSLVFDLVKVVLGVALLTVLARGLYELVIGIWNMF